MERNSELVVLRGRQEVYRGKLESLKRFQQDVSAVDAPADCGISISSFRDWQIGDIAESHGRIEIARTFPVEPTAARRRG